MMETMENVVRGICDITKDVLGHMVEADKVENLPIYISLLADACYVKYDIVNETVTDITLRMRNRTGITIDVDPIHNKIIGELCGEEVSAQALNARIGRTLSACIRTMWRARLASEELGTVGTDPQFIAADLLSDWQ